VTSTVGSSDGACIEAHPLPSAINTDSKKVTVRVLIRSPFLFRLGCQSAFFAEFFVAYLGARARPPFLLEEARYLGVNARRKREPTC